MTQEASKSMARRAENDFYQSIFCGNGVDIGAGDDCIDKHVDKFINILDVKNWDLRDGDAQYMESMPNVCMDFVHSSHCLEHMRDPFVAIENWIRIVKPGGYVVVTIPDWEMYEKFMWPSRYNTDHKTSWSMESSEADKHAHVLYIKDFLDRVCKDFKVELVKLERIIHRWDPDNKGDQTLPPTGPECAIEFVLKKK